MSRFISTLLSSNISLYWTEPAESLFVNNKVHVSTVVCYICNFNQHTRRADCRSWCCQIYDVVFFYGMVELQGNKRHCWCEATVCVHFDHRCWPVNLKTGIRCCF